MSNHKHWQPSPASEAPETPVEPMEFLSRTWSAAAQEVSRAVAPPRALPPVPHDARVSRTHDGADVAPENDDVLAGGDENGNVSGNTFSFASSKTSFLVMERILSQSPEISSPRISGRLSHSCGGSFSDSPPVSPSDIDAFKQYCRVNHPFNGQFRSPVTTSAAIANFGGGGSKTVGRWLKDRREKRKEEARAHNAQVHAAVSVAGVAAAVAAIAAATAARSSDGKDERTVKTDVAVASAATLVAAQCVEAAEAVGADREQLASVVSSAVNVQSAGDIMTLTAAAATALRGAAALKARALKEVLNIAAVIPVEKGMTGGGESGGRNIVSPYHGGSSGKLLPEDNFLGICGRELLAKGCQLLKRTRKGDLHWKLVSVYINPMNRVMLKTKSRHVRGTITKKKKNAVIEVVNDIPAWPERNLLGGGENRRYFGLKTEERGVIEFECRNQREYDVWTQGVSRLLAVAAERSKSSVRHRK